ncbi:MAG: response regulator [Firmicutes bacterium]|nr:response regulator [Bacillota bacterium]
MATKGARILVVDDEIEIRRLLKVALTAHGYDVGEAANGQEGLAQTALFHPDLVILDMSLPDLDGLEVISRLREWTKVPVIILSVREHEQDKIRALDLGAEDYVTKPFNMGELLARIRVALRHQAVGQDEAVLVLGGLNIDMAHRKVMVAEKEVKLTPLEYEILKNLAQNAGKVLTHRYLLTNVWGNEYQTQSHYLRIYIRQLRKKIEPNPTQPRYILTEPGIGYRLAIPE